MPLTISHPAAAIPFSRFGLNLPALIIGSMVSDVIYFIGLSEYREATHSIPGLSVCVAAGLILLWIYERLAKPPLLSLAPPWLRKAASNSKIGFWPAGRFLILLLSILIGAATHLLWDSFTHESGWMVEHLPVLKMTVMNLGFDRVPLSRLLHHAGSLIGAVLILTWTRGYLIRIRSQAELQITPDLNFRRLIPATVLLAACFSLGLLLSWLRVNPISTYDQLRRMMVGSIFASGTVLLFITFCYCALWHLKRQKN